MAVLSTRTALGSAMALLGSTSLTGQTVTTSQPLLNLTQTWNNAGVTFTAQLVNITDTASASGSRLATWQVNGADRAYIVKDGGFLGAGSFISTGASLRVRNDTGVVSLGSADDTILARDAANTLALRNGTNPQTFRVYDTYTDVSNQSHAFLSFSGGEFRIGTAAAGTGTVSDIYFRTNSANRWQIGNTAGHFLAATDNAYDIGASGANRPRAIYVAGTGTFGGAITATGNVTAGSGGNVIAGGSLYTANNTVAALPSAVGQTGARRFVTDANATTFASIVAGGGANGVPVYSDGTNWRIG